MLFLFTNSFSQNNPFPLIRKLTKLLLIACLYSSVAIGQDLSDNIRVNQVGYYTNSNKQAVVYESPSDSFSVINASTLATVYTDTLSAEKYWSYSNENVAIADFSEVTFSIASGDDQSLDNIKISKRAF